MSETKICARCGEEKPIEDFSKSYKKLCKKCVSSETRLRRHKERIAESQARGAASAMYGHRLTVATAAMQGLLASMKDDDSVVELAELAVCAADALLNELKKEK